ncbi:DUF2515 family protein [Pseudomonas veronii]
MQQLYQHVYEMMAMGNTTLFLDVFPLHAFYKERGLGLLERCLPLRRKIHGNGQSPVLWPVGHERLWTCPYQTGHQLPVKLMLLPSA